MNKRKHSMSKFNSKPELSEDDRKKSADNCLSIAAHVISTEGKDKNLVLAPMSLLVVMEMKEAVSTHLQKSSKTAEILRYVFADASKSGGPCLSCANGSWFDQSVDLKPKIQEILQTVFKAACARVDFKTEFEEVRNEVNEWAEKKTNGIIKELLPNGSVNDQTKAIYANAVYFKGVWSENFDKSMTKEDDFFLLDGDSVKVPFMTGISEVQSAQDFGSFKVLELSYQTSDFYEDDRLFSMYIFLPEKRDGIAALIERMQSESGFLDHHIPDQSAAVVDLRIPKFEIEFRFEAESLQLQTLIHGGDKNNIIMGDSEDRIIHKAFIKVDEHGTEAAAASADVGYCSAGSPPALEILDFVADHPFLFVIMERRTKTVLFFGQVLNPFSQ